MSSIDDKLLEILRQFSDDEDDSFNRSIQGAAIPYKLKAIAAIKQVFAEESSFDKYLRSLIPHDGKWRYVSFNIKIAPDHKIDWVDKAARKASGIDE